MMNNNFNNGAANNNNNELNGGKMIMVNGRVENLVAFGEVVKGAIDELCTDCYVWQFTFFKSSKNISRMWELCMVQWEMKNLNF